MVAYRDQSKPSVGKMGSHFRSGSAGQLEAVRQGISISSLNRLDLVAGLSLLVSLQCITGSLWLIARKLRCESCDLVMSWEWRQLQSILMKIDIGMVKILIAI